METLDDLMSTIARVFKAALGPVLQFAKTVTDKLGSYLCESGTEDETKKPPRCGLVGFVLGFVKIIFKTLLGFIDGAVDYLINLMTKVFIAAVPEIKNLFKAIDFDSPFVSSPCQSRVTNSIIVLTRAYHGHHMLIKQHANVTSTLTILFGTPLHK
jgi:hypothetical protein